MNKCESDIFEMNSQDQSTEMFLYYCTVGSRTLDAVKEMNGRLEDEIYEQRNKMGGFHLKCLVLA